MNGVESLSLNICHNRGDGYQRLLRPPQFSRSRPRDGSHSRPKLSYIVLQAADQSLVSISLHISVDPLIHDRNHLPIFTAHRIRDHTRTPNNRERSWRWWHTKHSLCYFHQCVRQEQPFISAWATYISAGHPDAIAIAAA